MDNELFTYKCFICNEPASEENPLELLPCDGDADEEGNAIATEYDYAHRDCHDELTSKLRD